MKPARLLAFMGLPASGKSTLARTLAQHLGYPVVDRDQVRAVMFPAGQRSEAEKQAASDATLSSLALHLRQGQSVIADGKPYSRRSEREALAALVRAQAGQLLWIWVDCPLPLATARIEADQAHPGRDGRAELVREVAARWEPAPADAIRVDASQPPAAMFQQLLDALPPLTD